MTVSVIVPCFNHGSYIEETVVGILRQTHPPSEVIIVDDCSRDDSLARIYALAATDSRIKVLAHERNLGASASRNDGIQNATGDFIAFCDADDLWMPEKLATQLTLLREYPSANIVYSDAKIIDESGRSTGHLFSDAFPVPSEASGTIFEQLCVRNFINMQTVLLRRQCLEGGIRFDGRIKWVEDWWFWIQLSYQNQFRYSPEPLAMYRVHSQSTNRTQTRGYERNRFKVYHRILTEVPKLSSAIRAKASYHMAACLAHLGWTKHARRAYIRSIAASISSWRAIIHLPRPLVRLIAVPPKVQN